MVAALRLVSILAQLLHLLVVRARSSGDMVGENFSAVRQDPRLVLERAKLVLEDLVAHYLLVEVVTALV